MNSRRISVVVPLCFVSGLPHTSSSAWAQESPLTCADRGSPRVALVVSGGVSLGAYQAGFLHYFTEYLKRLDTEAGESPIVAATGASAGSVNTSLAAFEMCRRVDKAAPVVPEQSLFYQTWHGLRIESLFPGNGSSVTAKSLLDRTPLEAAAEAVEAFVKADTGQWKQGCSSDLGFVATRLQGREVALRTDVPSLALDRMTEKFVMKFETTPGQTPQTLTTRFRHFARTSTSGPKLWLRPGPPQVDAPTFDDFRNVLFASTAFPVAFPPQAVTYHYAGESVPRSADFIDGGVFENIPVRLASVIVERRRRWEAVNAAEPRPLPRPVTYLVLSTDVTQWRKDGTPRSNRDAEPYSSDQKPTVSSDVDRGPRSLPDLIASFATDFLAASRAAELLSVVDQNVNLQALNVEEPEREDGCDSIQMPVRHYMLSSDHLFAFFGFLDEQFRALDFYLGMLDARRYVASTEKKKRRGQLYQYRRGQAPPAPKLDQAIDSPQFRCLAAIDDAYFGTSDKSLEDDFTLADAEMLCTKSDHEQTRELIKVLWANIQTTRQLRAENLPMDDAKAFQYFIDELDAQDFRFSLYLEQGEREGVDDRNTSRGLPASEVPLWLRGNMDRVLSLLSRRQPTFFAGLTTSTAGRLAANQVLEHSDPPSVLSLGPNANRGFDVAFDGGLGRRLQHRIGGALRVREIDFVGCDAACISAFGSADYRYSLGDAANWWLGFEFGAELGGGYIREPDKDFAALLLGASITATLLSRIYLRLDAFWTPKIDFEAGERDHLMFGVGVGVRFHDVIARD